MNNICMAERNMINRSRTSILGPRIRKCQEAYDLKQRRAAHSNSVEPQVLKYSSMIQKKKCTVSTSDFKSLILRVMSCYVSA